MNSPLLALDVGLRRTGVALSESGLIAQPLTTLEWQPPHAQPLIDAIVQLVRKHEARTLLVGIPLNEDNTPTQQAQKTEHVLLQIEGALRHLSPAPTVIRLNEWHSTQDGAQLFPDADKDAAAAAVLLQDYLEQQGEAW